MKSKKREYNNYFYRIVPLTSEIKQHIADKLYRLKLFSAM